MAGLLLILVFIDTMLTGWLLAQVKGLKKTVRTVAKVQRDMSRHDYVTSRPALYDDDDELEDA